MVKININGVFHIDWQSKTDKGSPTTPHPTDHTIMPGPPLNLDLQAATDLLLKILLSISVRQVKWALGQYSRASSSTQGKGDGGAGGNAILPNKAD